MRWYTGNDAFCTHSFMVLVGHFFLAQDLGGDTFFQLFILNNEFYSFNCPTLFLGCLFMDEVK